MQATFDEAALVKGSKDGGWLLAASYKEPQLSYHDAINAWLAAHADRTTLYCLVQFKGVALGTMPRVYLARPEELAEYLHASHAGEGYLSVREHYAWKKGGAAGTDRIPESWTFVKDQGTLKDGRPNNEMHLTRPRWLATARPRR